MPVFSLALTTEAVKESKYFEKKSERERVYSERYSTTDHRRGLVLSARWGAATAISALAWKHLDTCFVSPYLIN
jgi:hypothetical protein